MNAVDMNDIKTITINKTRFAIRKFRGLTSVRVGTAAIAALSPAAGLIGGLFGITENADADIGKSLQGLGASMTSLEPKKVESLVTELTILNKNVSYEQESRAIDFTESSIDELFGGDIQYLFELIKEVITLNYRGLFTWLGGLFGKAAEDGQMESLI